MKAESSNLLSNVIWKFSERILAQIISLLVSIVLARLVLPEEYGIIAMVLVFINIANVFVDSGFSSGLIQKVGADELDFSSVFYFNLGLSLLLYGCLFWCSPLISDFYNMPHLTPVLRVLGIRIVVTSLNSVQHAYVSRHMLFRKYFWSTLLGTVLSGVVGILLAMKGAGVWALVAQYMTNTTVDSIVLLFSVDWKPRLLFSIKRVVSLVSYSWKILFESLSETITQQVRNLVIGRVYTSDDLAFYSKGQQFPSIVVVNISSALSSVLFPAMSNIQEDDEELLKLLRKSIRITSFIVFPMLLGLFIVANPFITVLLTEKWTGTVPYLRVFCLIYATQVGLYPRHQALKAIGRSDVFMFEHMIYRVVSLTVLYFVYKQSVWAVAISGLFGAIILVVITAFTSKKYSHYSYSAQISDVWHSLFCCLIMGLATFGVGQIRIPNLPLLILQVVTGILVYFFSAKIMKFEELGFILEFVRKIKKGDST